MWRVAVRRMREVLDSQAPVEEKLAWAQRTILFACNDDDPVTRADSFVRWDKYLKRRWGDWTTILMDHRLEESKHYPDEFVFTHDGLRLSLDFLKKFNIALEAIEVGKLTSASRVLELDAGFGQVGRILMALRPGLEYVICDLPESLYFSEWFLRANNCEYKQLPAWAYRSVGGRFDCFINTSSLGEMPAEVARRYLDHFQGQCELQSCVLLNRLLNTYSPWREANRERECGWYWELDDRWRVKTWELEPEWISFPGIESLYARELLFIATREKQAVPPPTDDEVAAIERQQWCQKVHPASTRLRHIFAWDKELLRVLLERVRVKPDRRTLGALLAYLQRIEGPWPFEEMNDLYSRYGWCQRYGPFWLRRITSCLAAWRYARKGIL